MKKEGQNEKDGRAGEEPMELVASSIFFLAITKALNARASYE